VAARKKRRTPPRSGVRLGEPAARAMILQGAARLFAEQGVRAPSVEHILKASGVSRRTFYRLYSSKEDVVAALYTIGTNRLIERCTLALSEERESVRRIDRCIDAHLNSARELGRLVFVIGGEAQDHESPLYAERMRVHETLVSLLSEHDSTIDPLFFRGLILVIEGVTRVMLQESNEGRNVTDASVERARRVLARIVTAAVEGKGKGVAPMPLLKSERAR